HEALERDAVLELLHGRGENGRGVVDGRIDDAEVVVRVAAGHGQNSVGTGISFLRGHDRDYGTALSSAATDRCPATRRAGPATPSLRARRCESPPCGRCRARADDRSCWC